MAMLHYGGTRTFEVPDDDVAVLVKAIGERVADGDFGWVSFTDTTGQDWSILVSDGVQIFVDAKVQPPA